MRFTNALRGFARLAEPLAHCTSFRIGGAADILARPRTVDELRETMRFASGEGLPAAWVASTNLAQRVSQAHVCLLTPACRTKYS